MDQTGRRCFGDGDPLYSEYHDTEWGVPVRGEAELLERFCLEAFQSGLSWLTVLRKRPAFRAAFLGFDPEAVARLGEDDVARLLADPGIIRNRAKIEAAIAGGRAVLGLWEAGRTLTDLAWSHAPEPRAEADRPRTYADVPASTPAAVALAKELKSVGFRFIGPTTAYASMQACGLVDDHLADCPVVLAR
ncbi:DNA-3-methyladenine glycosylase I [Actinotalea fermentans]|nr:DNA-3-methyladenine glycosylase I [Actinotalea fermentans]